MFTDYSLYSQYFNFEYYLKNKGYIFLGAGCSRRTFAHPDKDFVIKIPYSDRGVDDNHREATVYRKYKNNPTMAGYMLAACRLLPLDCLLMRRVTELSEDDDRFPKWGWEIDCAQVGVTKDGKVVAYDYALDVWS